MTHTKTRGPQTLVVGGAIVAVVLLARQTVEALTPAPATGAASAQGEPERAPSHFENGPPAFPKGATDDEYQEWLRLTAEWWRERKALRGLGDG